jgi:hypothetical protein
MGLGRGRWVGCLISGGCWGGKGMGWGKGDRMGKDWVGREWMGEEKSEIVGFRGWMVGLS